MKKERKKVGLLISQMNNGGAERVVSRLTNILSEDVDIYLILFEDTFMEYEYSGTLISLDIKAQKNIFYKSFNLLRRILALRKIKRQYGMDIVISFLDSPNLINILSKTKVCKVFISIRNYSSYENSIYWLKKIQELGISLLYNKADMIIPVTKVIANSYEKDYRISKEKMKVIYNPYDINEIQNLANDNLEDSYKNFIHKGKTFISVGRYMHQKGFWHLIKAFKLVHDLHNDAKLIIVGKDYDNGKVEKLIHKLNLNESVLLTGQQKNPFNFIKNSDIYVLSSLFEGFPNALVEAMACGCPVIATDCKSGPREILYENPDLFRSFDGVEKGDYGILISLFDRAENWAPDFFDETDKNLSNAMLMFLEDENLRKYYSKKALERAKMYNYEAAKKHYTDIIEAK